MTTITPTASLTVAEYHERRVFCDEALAAYALSAVPGHHIGEIIHAYTMRLDNATTEHPDMAEALVLDVDLPAGYWLTLDRLNVDLDDDSLDAEYFLTLTLWQGESETDTYFDHESAAGNSFDSLEEALASIKVLS